MGFGFVGVGALYEDTLISLPWFPKEDEKLRATAVTTRVGGNIPNTLNVLSQVSFSDDRLIFISAFATKSVSQRLTDTLSQRNVQVAGVWRECFENPSSWILRSKETGSRTIVNSNGVDEITCEELVQIVGSLGDVENIRWIHFEGRIPDVLHAAIPRIRTIIPQATLSIEFEKPDRPGLLELLPFADVVFFSHSYFTNFQPYIHDKTSKFASFFATMRDYNPTAILLVTIGAGGAIYCTPNEQGGVDASRVEVVDATGAGDTFIGGFMWARGKLRKGVRESVEVAVALATQKVSQEGFDGVWQTLDRKETVRSK